MSMTDAAASSFDRADGVPDPVQSIRGLVAELARIDPHAPAIGAPDRSAMTYGALLEQLDYTASFLNQTGVGRGDRVALVAPGGPESAASFLSIAACATCAPLNPGYKAAEFEFFLDDLNARVLVVPRGSTSEAIAVATRREIPILELEPGSIAGSFTLSGEGPRGARQGGPAEPDDVALVLHTSGTTARPKIVPLSQRNLLASARSIARTLALGPGDRCLNIMPLFHIHGLIGATLSSITAGASVHCAPTFDPALFFGWLAELRPTWYTAVPTMHQAILEAGSAHRDVVAGNELRFIRSSSAALPENVMTGLERMFYVPVLEAYGMTEASHQMASNPLPPLPRKPRSVGVAAGPEIRVVDEDGNSLPACERGEVVIRGPGVTSGYDDNESANASAFIDGFFRTGDQGYLDADGYLFLTGRLKEIINRAGEKVSPREIDEVLASHSAVRQAVAFGVPHSTLGEDVAAAVVLRPGAEATESELRAFVRDQLAAFKVPQQILIVDAIPVGATGKLQRNALAALLEGELRADFVAPRTPLEEGLAAVWAHVLKLDRVSVTANFFALGGDSLTAAVIINRSRHLGIAADIFLQHPTVAEIVAVHREREKIDAAPAKREPVITAPPHDKQRRPGLFGRLFASK